MGIGIGAIAAYIGAGGLGEYIFQGIGRDNDKMIIIGAAMISVITIFVDRIFRYVQKFTEVN
jgi:osmoprotectant transport system permease protein